MADTFKLGIMGLVHDHIWIFYQDDVKEIDNCEITCAADPNADLLVKAQDIYGVKKEGCYTSYEEMLDKEELDAVLIFAPSNEHGKLTSLAAKKGLHVMVEKPMAATLAEADMMLKVCEENKVRLMINYPIANKPGAPGLIKMIKDGAIGTPYLFRWRMGHNGPENQKILSKYFCDWLFDPEKNGGGAMADFCTYGAAVLTTAMGSPDEVIAMTANSVKKDQKAEDNGIIVMRYNKTGAMAILEGTWSQMAPGANNCFFGDKGSIVNSPVKGIDYKLKKVGGDDWEDLSFPDRPANEDKAIKYFVRRLREDLPFEGMVDPNNARAAQEVIEAAYIAVNEKKQVSLPLK